jgi:Flp pilus assembly protein TadG
MKAGRCIFHENGQSIVEFGLILPFLLLFIMGTLNLGQVFYNKLAIQSAAREGAYYLSYNTADSANCVATVCFQGTRAAIRAEANNLGVIIPDANIVISGVLSSGATIQVDIAQPVNLMIYSLINGPVVLTSQVRMVVQ